MNHMKRFHRCPQKSDLNDKTTPIYVCMPILNVHGFLYIRAHSRNIISPNVFLESLPVIEYIAMLSNYWLQHVESVRLITPFLSLYKYPEHLISLSGFEKLLVL